MTISHYLSLLFSAAAILIMLSTAAAFTYSSSTPYNNDCFSFLPKNSQACEHNNRRNDPLFMSLSGSWENEREEPYQNQLDSHPLEPLQESDVRKARRKREQELKDHFVSGNDLQKLRFNVNKLKMEFQDAVLLENSNRIKKLQKKITLLQRKDAEFVYEEALREIDESRREEREEDLVKIRQVAMDARSCLPHFNLEGLWIGKYGNHGYEMINVTYVGDTLVAYKVTGDKNVPKGEITFTVDLTPYVDSGLEPVKLSESAAAQWGIKYLNRFPGIGQVAFDGYTEKQWVKGQLLMVGEYISFAWLPLGHQVFFGRPSPELTLNMLKKSQMLSENENVAQMKAYATRCLEETISLEEDERVEYPFFGSNDYGAKGCFD